MKRKNKKKEEGFLVLIAVMVSMILLSIGLFIASTSVRQIKLSSSVKESQRAFNAADSVTQCALLKEFKGGGFATSTLGMTHDVSHGLRCNGNIFDWDDSSYAQPDSDGDDHMFSIYYISFAPSGDSGLADLDSDNMVDKDEITGSANKYSYVKLIVDKPSTSFTKKTIIRAYGHNQKTGNLIVERAIETKY